LSGFGDPTDIYTTAGVVASYLAVGKEGSLYGGAMWRGLIFRCIFF